MEKVTIKPFDISKHLKTEEDIKEYLKAILEENDTDLLLMALGDIAKARGMTQIAKDSGLSRESLYKALSPNSHPRFDTIQKVLHAMNIKLTVETVK